MGPQKASSASAVALAAMAAMLMAATAVAQGPIVPYTWSYTGNPKGWVYKGEQRQYHTLNPNGEMKRGKVPVILCYHGNGADAAAFALQLPVLVHEARRRGYMLVFPEGVQTPGSTMRCKERSWNAGSCCGEAVVQNVDDVGFTRAVLADLLASHPEVDRSRVYVTGSSNGGSMAIRLVCEIPDLLAAAGPEIGSLEALNGDKCASACESIGGGYEDCEWDVTVKGCDKASLMRSLPRVYSCSKLRTNPTPMLIFNGRLDPLSNVSGLIERPVVPTSNKSMFTISFPPMEAAIEALRAESGCTGGISDTVVSFRNGTKGNSTTCHTWPTGGGACPVNFTYCLSDAGHRWYGSTYPQYELCRWEGYDDADCDPASDLALYGPNTLSVSVALQLLDFFDAQAP